MTLLEKAMEGNPPRNNTSAVSDEEVELAIAWFHNQISTSAAGKVMGAKGSSFHQVAIKIVRRGVLDGRVILRLRGKEERIG